MVRKQNLQSETCEWNLQSEFLVYAFSLMKSALMCSYAGELQKFYGIQTEKAS